MKTIVTITLNPAIDKSSRVLNEEGLVHRSFPIDGIIRESLVILEEFLCGFC